jgi:hypothetical protein
MNNPEPVRECDLSEMKADALASHVGYWNLLRSRWFSKSTAPEQKSILMKASVTAKVGRLDTTTA